MTNSLLLEPPVVRPPAWRTVARGPASSGAEAIARAADAGLYLDPWQEEVLRDALQERADGTWASYEVGLCCPRQNGKSAVLEALMLWSLFDDPEAELTIYTAHEFKTTREIFRRIDGLIGGSDELRGRVKRRVSTLVEMGFETFDGKRLLFLARSGSSGRGFSCDRPIFDEAMILPAEAMLAMLPMLSARPNPQAWFTGSAGMATSDYWRGVRDRGRAGSSKRLTWIEYAADELAELDDRQAWIQANPGYPARLSDDAIASELDAVRGGEDTIAGWRRERLGLWDEATGVQVIPPAIWEQHAEPASRIVSQPVFALDVSPLSRESVIAVAGLNEQGRPQIEITAEDIDGEIVYDYRPGTDWVIPRMVDLATRHGVWTVHLYGQAAESLRVDLEREGLTVDAPKPADMGAGCGTFYDLAIGPAGTGLVHLDQPQLNIALVAARRAETDHGWQWGRRKSTRDISPLVASTVALWALTTQPTGDPSAYWI